MAWDGDSILAQYPKRIKEGIEQDSDGDKCLGPERFS